MIETEQLHPRYCEETDRWELSIGDPASESDYESIGEMYVDHCKPETIPAWMNRLNAALSPRVGVELTEEDLEQLGCAVGWLERCSIDPAGKIAPAIQELLTGIIAKARSAALSAESVVVRREVFEECVQALRSFDGMYVPEAGGKFYRCTPQHLAEAEAALAATKEQ